MEIDDKKNIFNLNKEDDKAMPDSDSPDNPVDAAPEDDAEVTFVVVPELHLNDIPYVQALHNLVARLLGEMAQTMPNQESVHPDVIVEEESPFAAQEAPTESDDTPEEEVSDTPEEEVPDTPEEEVPVEPEFSGHEECDSEVKVEEKAESQLGVAPEPIIEEEIIVETDEPAIDEVTVETETPLPEESPIVTETPIEPDKHPRVAVFDEPVVERKKYTPRREDYKRRSRAPITTISDSASAILPWIWWTLAAIAAVIIAYFGYETYETYFADNITQSEMMIEDFTNDGLTENPFGDMFSEAANAEMASEAVEAVETVETVETEAVAGATEAEVVSAPANTNVAAPTRTATPAPAADLSPQNAVETPAVSDNAAVAEEASDPAAAIDEQVEEEALRVIRGEYGSGPERFEMLREKGLDVEAIQSRVNQLKNMGAF